MHGLLGFCEPDELGWDGAALVHQLVETVLAVGAGLTEVHYSGLIRKQFSSEVHTFSITFHIELLNVWDELAQSLAIGKNSPGGVLLDCGSIEPDKPQHHRDVFLTYI